MVAKMMKWMPWPVLSTQKFQLGLVLHELEGLCLNGVSDKLNLMVHIKWKGPRGKLGSRFRSVERNCTAMRTVGDKGTVEWNESFDHVCVLTMLRGNAFHRWDVAFEVINAPDNDLNSRLSVVGTSFLNIAEFVSYGKNNGTVITPEAAIRDNKKQMPLDVKQYHVDNTHQIGVDAFATKNLLRLLQLE